MIRLVNDGFFDGANHIITLEIIPFHYYAEAGNLYLYKSLSFTVNTVSNSYNILEPNVRLSRNQSKVDNFLINLVDNPTDVSANQHIPNLVENTTSFLLTVPVFYEYVIITTNTIKPYFDDFVDWKRKKGFDIGVVTTDEIFSNYSGDLISGIYDNAGKIRQYLYDGYSTGGTLFALLAGDYNTVPIRKGNISNNEPGEDAAVPADLYFADFNGDWDVDGDAFYGEMNEDNIDYYNEIYVSRLLCNDNDASNVSNWVIKVLIYEQNPGNGDYDYLTRNFFDQADQAQEANYAGFISPIYPIYFANTIKEEVPSYDHQSPTSPYGDEIIDAINDENFGLISVSTHGDPTHLRVLTIGINGNQKSNLYSLTDYATWVNPGSLDELTNNDRGGPHSLSSFFTF